MISARVANDVRVMYDLLGIRNNILDRLSNVSLLEQDRVDLTQAALLIDGIFHRIYRRKNGHANM